MRVRVGVRCVCVVASVPSVPILISLAHVVCGLDELHTFSVSKKRDVSVTLERGAEESESKHGNDANPIGVQVDANQSSKEWSSTSARKIATATKTDVAWPTVGSDT